MKKSFTCFVFLLLCFVFSAFAQENPARLIIRVDDMGFSHSGNQAILKTLKYGIATSVEILAPSPWFPEAVALLQGIHGIDIGVHITLTSEWSNMKYRPITHSPSIVDGDGYFYPFIWPNKNYPEQTLMENKYSIADIEKEFRAQIELALKKLPNISHVSAHMGCYEMTPEVKEMTRKLVREYKIDIDPIEYNVERATYAGQKETSEQKKQSFIKMLENLKPGKTYLFVDHPGLDTPELKAIHHAGYEQVAVDRQGVTDVLTDPDVKLAINKLGIELISYADLVK